MLECTTKQALVLTLQGCQPDRLPTINRKNTSGERLIVRPTLQSMLHSAWCQMPLEHLQIRVHLAHLGLPMLGDEWYGTTVGTVQLTVTFSVLYGGSQLAVAP